MPQSPLKLFKWANPKPAYPFLPFLPQETTIRVAATVPLSLCPVMDQVPPWMACPAYHFSPESCEWNRPQNSSLFLSHLVCIWPHHTSLKVVWLKTDIAGKSWSQGSDPGSLSSGATHMVMLPHLIHCQVPLQGQGTTTLLLWVDSNLGIDRVAINGFSSSFQGLSLVSLTSFYSQVIYQLQPWSFLVASKSFSQHDLAKCMESLFLIVVIVIIIFHLISSLEKLPYLKAWTSDIIQKKKGKIQDAGARHLWLWKYFFIFLNLSVFICKLKIIPPTLQSYCEGWMRKMPMGVPSTGVWHLILAQQFIYILAPIIP